MLQLRTAGYKALDNLRSRGEFPPQWDEIRSLELVTDLFMERFLAERLKVSTELGPGFLMPEMIDRGVRTSESEHMDRREVAGEEKLRLISALDRMNSMTLIYEHQIGVLSPLIDELALRSDRPVRVLELAAGSGGLALTLAGHAHKNGIDIAITASDIVPDVISDGNRRAAELKLPVTFRLMNAFDFNGMEANGIDIVIISQSMHHFSPGQLAMMIAQAKANGARAFTGIDGYRSLLLLGGVPLVASLQGITDFTLDGLTSARKFYSEIELDIITHIATAGHSRHSVECSWPLTVLTARFDSA
jgi:2-polyprenyl-3-methyl-5-hydroxy-6-metoxy-1,4-benzoquinol methylase